MSNPLDRHLEWLNQHTEEIIDAERPIIDPHLLLAFQHL